MGKKLTIGIVVVSHISFIKNLFFALFHSVPYLEGFFQVKLKETWNQENCSALPPFVYFQRSLWPFHELERTERNACCRTVAVYE